jgi:hypothetical protein
MPPLADRVRAELAHGTLHYALEMALDAALKAGQDALPDTRGRPAAERFAVALQAATDVLDGLALEMTGGGTAAGQ